MHLERQGQGIVIPYSRQTPSTLPLDQENAMETPIPSHETALSELLAKNSEILVCPVCGGGLELSCDPISCLSCGKRFSSENGIPQLFWQNDWPADKPDVTEIIKSFYEKTPFPNYDELDSSLSLREKASRGIFARLLDEQISFGSRVLEVGCGTGQRLPRIRSVVNELRRKGREKRKL